MPPEAVEWYRRVRLSLFSLEAPDRTLGTKQNLDFNVPGGKLNRGQSVVDSVQILKGRGLTDDEYFKAALLGWCIELVGSPVGLDGGSLYSFSSFSFTSSARVRVDDAATSLFPRLGRHDGSIDHPSWTAVLVPRSRRGQYRDQRFVHARRGDLSPPQEALPFRAVLCPSSRIVSRRCVFFPPLPLAFCRVSWTETLFSRRRFRRRWGSWSI